MPILCNGNIATLNAGLAHIGVAMDVNGVGYGRVALGLEPDIAHI